jgi:hypothetical protein
MKFYLFFLPLKSPYATYDSTTHNCDVNKNLLQAAKNLYKPCKKDSDCGSPALACDTSSLGNQTNTCLALYGQVCLAFDGCVDSLECKKILCVCVS